jgi:hypothetical protein
MSTCSTVDSGTLPEQFDEALPVGDADGATPRVATRLAVSGMGDLTGAVLGEVDIQG